MESQVNNIMKSFTSKKDAVVYVADILQNLREDFVWTTIMFPDESGAWLVISVTGTSLEDIETLTSLYKLPIT